MVLILGSLAWAAGSVFNRHGSRPDSAAMSTGLQMIGGSVALLLLGVMGGELADVHVRQISAASWMGWIYLVTFGSLVGFTAYIYLLADRLAAKASTYAYVNPLVAVFLGWAIAGESVTPSLTRRRRDHSRRRRDHHGQPGRRVRRLGTS